MLFVDIRETTPRANVSSSTTANVQMIFLEIFRFFIAFSPVKFDLAFNYSHS